MENLDLNEKNIINGGNMNNEAQEDGFTPYDEYNTIKKETELSKLFSKVWAETDDNLDLNRVYYGKIIDIAYGKSEKYERVSIIYAVNDDPFGSKRTTDTYTFGGEFDEWNARQLVSFLKDVYPHPYEGIDYTSVENLAKSLQFLVGMDINLFQYNTVRGNRKNCVSFCNRNSVFENPFTGGKE